MKNIWFSSDWHFGHANILKHQPLRAMHFSNIEAMDDFFINSINEIVKPHDTLYFLGDFCWRANSIKTYRQHINVHNLCVCRGNHDKSSLGKFVSQFEHMLFIKFKKIIIHLCHYPLISWSASNYGSIHLYGHCHGNMEEKLNKLNPNRLSMDVGIDNIYKLIGKWRPINLEEILKCLKF